MPPARTPATTEHRRSRRGTRGGGALADLEGQPVLGFVGPNWFATVMGTGIIANAVATLPVHAIWLDVFARTVWVADTLVLVVVVTATSLHWLQHREVAAGHLADPVLGHFYGAPPMALITVGAGALLVGTPVIGMPAAVLMDAVLWSTGTVLGLVTAVLLPYRTFATGRTERGSAFGGWLMPVVPPMVSAATGPLLLAHLPAGQWRLSLLLACSMMFGLGLLASLIVIPMIWSRLAHHGPGPAVTVPTLWIVLGPLGQSVTAAHTIGTGAAGVLGTPYASAFRAAALLYGLPVFGFALMWLAVALAVTVRTLRQGMPFALTWWSFTFPLGTVVTGASALALVTHARLVEVLAVVLYTGLVAAWSVVATRTVLGVYRGSLLRTPA